MERPKNWFPGTRGAVYLWLSQCTVAPIAFWKCVFWDTLYIYLKWVWSVRRKSPKVQKSHCVHSNLTKAEKTAGCVCLCLCLSFCLRLNLCLCLWLLPKTQKRNCTSYTLANVDNELSVFVFFLVWSFVFVFVTHQKCKRATVCTPPWPRQDKQLSRKYKLTNRPTIFSSERFTLDRVIFRVMNMKCASHFDPDQQLFRCEHKIMNM